MSTCDRCKNGPGTLVRNFEVDQDPAFTELFGPNYTVMGTECQVYSAWRPLPLSGTTLTPESCPDFEDAGNRLEGCRICEKETPVSCHWEGACSNCLDTDRWCTSRCDGADLRNQCPHWQRVGDGSDPTGKRGLFTLRLPFRKKKNPASDFDL